MRLDERHRSRGLINLARLDTYESVLDDVDAANSLSSSTAVHLLNRFERTHCTRVDSDRDAALERHDELIGDRWKCRVIRVVVHVFRRLVPNILEEPGFDRASPNVLVNGERVVLRRGDRKVVFLRVVDCLVASECEVSHGCDALKFRGERGN